MAPNHRKAARESKLAPAPTTVVAKAGVMLGLQSTLFWGVASAAFAVILTVFASMMKDSRLLLIAAFPFIIVAVWEFARAAGSKKPVALASIGGAISFIVLSCIYYSLRPVNNLDGINTLESKTSSVAVDAPVKPDVGRAMRPPTLLEIFYKDFPTFAGSGMSLAFLDVSSKKMHRIPVRMLLDYTAHTKFLAVFLDGSVDMVKDCQTILQNLMEIIKLFDTVKMGTRTTGDTEMRWSDTFIFSKTIYIYMNFDMTLLQEADIERVYAQNGLTVEFRGSDYFALHVTDQKFQQPTDPPASLPPTLAPLPRPAKN